MQIKLAATAGALLLIWLFSRKATAATVGRVTKEIEVDADVYSPTFGMTAEQIAAQRANPAVDPTMRELIDRSNRLIAEDDIINGVE